MKTIASDPDEKYVFKVNDFSVLKEIQDTLEENIIAIEGIQEHLSWIHFPYHCCPVIHNVRVQNSLYLLKEKKRK